MKRRHTVTTDGTFPALADQGGEAAEPDLPAGHTSNPAPAPNPEAQLMALLVEASSKACARDIAEAQATDRLPTAYQNGPAHVIAQLIDTGKAGWVRAFFHSFVRSLHNTEQLVGLETIRSEKALLAISEQVPAQIGDAETWERTLHHLEAEVFPDWVETYAC
jgi:hypothetical protein